MEKVGFEQVENTILERWKKEKPFRFDKTTGGEIFSIDHAPPYINERLHVGHLASNTYTDTIARLMRLSGRNVLFSLGLDRNGLPIEIQAEKEYGVDIRKTPREEFLKACKLVLDKYENKNKESLERLGMSFNELEVTNKLGTMYETDSSLYRSMTQDSFIELWNGGLIYEDTKIVNYCSACHTTVADAEVEYEEKETSLNFIKLDIDGKTFEIATTRPELIPACAAIAANPSDERYSGLKKAVMPITNAIIPLVYDTSIDKDFGTGLMMICSFGDKNDVVLFKKFGLKEKIIISNNGKIKDTVKYDGLSVSKAREKIIEDLKSAGVLTKSSLTKAQKPTCWRSHTPIEFLPEKEFYLKQKEFKDELFSISKKMRVVSEKSRQILDNWINSVDQDWPISRTRFYGTEIPLWSCNKCSRYLVPKPGKYYQPWKEQYPGESCTCGSKDIKGETRVLDTWMDSSVSNMFVLGYNMDKKFFEGHFPASVRVQGKEIIRTWLFYSLLKSYLMKKDVPFESVLVHYHVTDEKGEKMSKSKGNGVFMEDAIKEHGADIVRLWVYLSGDLLDGDIRYSKDKLNEAKRIITKLRNMANFIRQFKYEKDGEQQVIDDMDAVIMNAFDSVYNSVLKNYLKYNFFKGVKELKDFMINVFADHYLELKKPYAYAGDKSTLFTLNYVFKNCLELLNPVIPFVTEYVYGEMNNANINTARLATKKEASHLILSLEKTRPGAMEFLNADLRTKYCVERLSRLMEFDSMVWTKKKSKGIALNAEISEVDIPADLEPFKEVLIKAHKLKI